MFDGSHARRGVMVTAAVLAITCVLSAQKINPYTTRNIELNVHSGVFTGANPRPTLVYTHPVRFPDTSWCRLELSGIDLLDGDYIKIVARKNGSEQVVTSTDPQLSEPVFYTGILVGGDLDVELWLGTASGRRQLTSEAILLARPKQGVGIDSICGPMDNRMPIMPQDPCIVRIVDSMGGWGSGFMISDNWCITAHHVMTNGPWTIQRNVPASNAAGMIQPPAANDQFTLANLNNSKTGSNAFGNDWAVLNVPNNAAGAPGAGCNPTFNCNYNNNMAGQPLKVDGFGVDSEPMRNGVAQTDTGPSVGGPMNANHFRHRADTRGNSSGSRVTDAQGRIIGIHTHGGCTGGMPEMGSNGGTLISNPLLVAAIKNNCGIDICVEKTYDNGPLETQSLPGFSDLQFTALGHNVYGYGGQLTATVDNSIFDEFIVCQPTLIEDVEFFTYQTGAGNGPSTITGAYIAFYDSDPATQPQPPTPMAGSPLPTTDMFATPNNPLANTWNGLHRSLDGNGATNRAIMRVRVRLEDAAGAPTPLLLLPGTYWFERQAAGSLTSGPWHPPITCENQLETGNAKQLIGATGVWNDPIVSGGAGQGVPFLLWGGGTVPGSIEQIAAGCGQTGITVCGAPNLGGFIRTELTPSNPTGGIPIIGYDIGANPQPFCVCTAIHAFPIALWFAVEHEIQIPLDPGFCGLPIGVQGAEFQGIGGCPAPPINFTDGYLVKVNM